jgi:hypothetical protein
MGFEVNEFWSCPQWALIGGLLAVTLRERLTSLHQATDRSFFQLIVCIKISSSAIFRGFPTADINLNNLNRKLLKKLLTNGPKFLLILLWHHGPFSFIKVSDSISDEVIGYFN